MKYFDFDNVLPIIYVCRFFIMDALERVLRKHAIECERKDLPFKIIRPLTDQKVIVWSDDYYWYRLNRLKLESPSHYHLDAQRIYELHGHWGDAYEQILFDERDKNAVMAQMAISFLALLYHKTRTISSNSKGNIAEILETQVKRFAELRIHENPNATIISINTKCSELNIVGEVIPNYEHNELMDKIQKTLK